MTNLRPAPNDRHKADIVIMPELSGAYRAWRNNKVIATGTAEAMRLVVAGASTQRLSVYDAEADHFLTGSIAQMFSDEERAA